MNTLGMNEGVGEDGGFLVPPEFRDGIMKIVEGEDSLLSQCDNSTTARNAVTQNVDKTTPWGTAGINVYWEGEGPGGLGQQAKFEQNTLRLNKLFARVDVTDELLEDAPQLDNYLRVKAPEVMTSVINLAIVQGNGVGKPLGFMNSGALVTVAKETSQPADTIMHRNLVKMMGRMYAPSWPRAKWLMHQDVWAQLPLISFRDIGSYPRPRPAPRCRPTCRRAASPARPTARCSAARSWCWRRWRRSAISATSRWSTHRLSRRHQGRRDPGRHLDPSEVRHRRDGVPLHLPAGGRAVVVVDHQPARRQQHAFALRHARLALIAPDRSPLILRGGLAPPRSPLFAKGTGHMGPNQSVLEWRADLRRHSAVDIPLPPHRPRRQPEELPSLPRAVLQGRRHRRRRSDHHGSAGHRHRLRHQQGAELHGPST
jgi:hypothetical protein